MLRHLIITLFVCWQLKYTWIINTIMFNGPSYSSLLIALIYIHHHISWHADITFCKNIFIPGTIRWRVRCSHSFRLEFRFGCDCDGGDWCGGGWWSDGKGNGTSKNLINYFRLNTCNVCMYWCRGRHCDWHWWLSVGSLLHSILHEERSSHRNVINLNVTNMCACLSYQLEWKVQEGEQDVLKGM